MKSPIRLLLALVFVLPLAPRAHAATVTFYMSTGDNNGAGALAGNFNAPGQWTLYATVSKDDNFGLASFGVTLTGTSSIIIDAPKTIHHDSRSDSGDPNANPDVTAGFTLLRSITVDSFAHTSSLSASQDTITSAGYFIEHFGQTSGNLLPPPPGWDSTFSNTQTTYYNVLKIAHGSYPFSPPYDQGPQFVTGPTHTAANVFTLDLHGLVTQRTTAADVQFKQAGAKFFIDYFAITPLPPLDVPEPASLIFFSLPALCLLHRRRMRSSYVPSIDSSSLEMP